MTKCRINQLNISPNRQASTLVKQNFASCKRTFTIKDIDQFSEITGDHNLIHFDDTFAQKLNFKSRLVPGHLVNRYLV